MDWDGGNKRGGGRGGSGRGAPKRQGVKSALVSRFEKERGGARGGRGRGRGRGDSRGGRGGRGDADYGTGEREFGFKLLIQNISPDTKVQDLVEFLQSKAAQPFSVSESFIRDGKAFLIVDNRQEAIAVQKLSGIRFNQNKLAIKFVKYSGPSAMGEKQKAALASVVEPRFNAQAKYLNLSQLQGSEVEGFKLDFNNVSTVRSLWTVIAQKCPTVRVTTINFASNRIQNLTGFKDLSNHISGLVNMSLEENNITDFKQLDNLKQIKLRELVLAGNPISSENDETTYRSQVTRRFPGLKYLDRVKLQPVISFDIPSYVLQSVLPSSQPAFFDSPQRQSLAIDFLRKFYELYDKNRQGLLEIYTDFSFFSLAIGALGDGQKDKQKGLAEYINANRNLIKTEDMERRVELLQTGRVDIVHLLSKFPTSHHQLESLTVDAYMLPPVGTLQIMQINAHGHFWEVETGVNRSFDRSFLLTPAPAGSRAVQYGFPVVIMNDMLHIRNYVHSSGDPSTPQLGSGPGSSSVPPPSLSLTPTKPSVPSLFGSASPVSLSAPTTTAELVQKLSYVTELKLEYATQCLERNGWDYSKALTNFYELKSKGVIPPEAFLKAPTDL